MCAHFTISTNTLFELIIFPVKWIQEKLTAQFSQHQYLFEVFIDRKRRIRVPFYLFHTHLGTQHFLPFLTDNKCRCMALIAIEWLIQPLPFTLKSRYIFVPFSTNLLSASQFSTCSVIKTSWDHITNPRPGASWLSTLWLKGQWSYRTEERPRYVSQMWCRAFQQKHSSRSDRGSKC